MQVLDASCGILVIENIDISISDGIIYVTPTNVRWATGMVAVAVGNNKIVRFLPAAPNIPDWGSCCCHCCTSTLLVKMYIVLQFTHSFTARTDRPFRTHRQKIYLTWVAACPPSSRVFTISTRLTPMARPLQSTCAPV